MILRLLPALLAALLTLSPSLGAQSRPAVPPVPYRFAPVTIVGGGFISGIVFHPAQKGLAYLRTDIGGAYRWEDASGRWIPLNDFNGQSDSNDMGIESIGIDPSDPRRLYLAVGRFTQSWAGKGAILRSTDQGRSFETVRLPIQMGANEDGREAGERLAVDPNDGRVLYFGSRNDGLWRSADEGKSWARVASFPGVSSNRLGVVFELFDKASGQPGRPTPTIYAAVSTTGASLFRSIDAGASWQPVAGAPSGLLPIQGVVGPNRKIVISFADAPGPEGMTTGQLWRLNLADGVWKQITPHLPGLFGPTYGYAAVAIDRRHPETIAVSTMDSSYGGDTVFRTTDGGGHWTSLKERSTRDASLSPWLMGDEKTPRFGHWIGAVAIDPFDSGHMLYGTGETLWASHDATEADAGRTSHWVVGAAGIEETAAIALVSPPSGSAHLFSALADVGGFMHLDFSISPASGGDGLDYAGLNPQNWIRTGRTWGSPSHGGYSLDGGWNWHPFPVEPADAKNGGNAAISANGELMYWAVTGGALNCSTDQGKHWQPIDGLPKSVQVVADKVLFRQVYAYSPGSGDFYASAENGTRFAKVYSLVKGGKIAAVPGKAAELWFAHWNGLSHSSAGRPFAPVAGVTRAYAVGFGKAQSDGGYPTLYLSGEIANRDGIYRSTDAGASWVRIDDPQHRYGDIGAISGDPRIFGRVYLGTNGRGIFWGDPAR
jgi:photosystem II stability/assembly factor-like uncharacterized protein